MLIISDFHDYYDTALAHGIDKTCVYQRRQKKLDLPTDRDSRIMLRVFRDRKGEQFCVRPWVIGFAGAVYPLVTVTKRLGRIEETDQVFYVMADLTRCLDERIPEVRKNHNRYRSFWWNLSDLSLTRFYDPARWHAFLPLFERHRVPIFVVRFGQSSRKRKLILNPCLKEFRFMRIKDPYTALQDVHMYLSGVLGGLDRDMAEVDEKDRITQRGFNKWSFRREPTKKRRGK